MTLIESSSSRVHGDMKDRCALYLRQSVDREEGIASQEERTRALAAERGWEVTGVYTDNAVSTYRARGPKSAWARLLQDANAGMFKYVVFTDQDRLVRGQRDLIDLIDAGLLLYSLSGEIDLSSADGEFRATLMASLARFEVRRKSERQKRANAYRTSQGRPVPGRRRYGYEQDNITPRADEAAVVQFMFQQFVETGSIRSVAQILNKEGKRPTTGTDTWTTRRVRETLANRSYIGEVRHLGTWTKSTSLVPLVDADLFEHATRILADPTRRTSPGAEIRHLLSGLAVCGVCGSRMTYMRSYRCRADASHPSIKKETLETVVMREVTSALLLGPSAILPAVGDEEDTLESLEAALARVRDQREGIMSLVRAGLTQAADERPTLQRLKDEERRLAARRDQVLQSSVAAEVLAGIKSHLFDGHQADMQKAVEAKRALAERVNSLSLHRHRELIDLLIHVTVNPGRSLDRVVVAHRVVTSLND